MTPKKHPVDVIKMYLAALHAVTAVTSPSTCVKKAVTTQSNRYILKAHIQIDRRMRALVLVFPIVVRAVFNMTLETLLKPRHRSAIERDLYRRVFYRFCQAAYFNVNVPVQVTANAHLHGARAVKCVL